MLYAHWSEVPKEEWPYQFFTPRELASKGDGSLLINHDAIERLERLRTLVMRPIIITSAYRDRIHNAKVGGAPLSEHKKGTAFDIRLIGHDKHSLYKLAQYVGFTGFGFYRTFLHVDTGTKRSWGSWS